jgi:hypothetical protein
MAPIPVFLFSLFNFLKPLIMNTKLLLSLFLLVCSVQLLAQSKANNLNSKIVGTWKMVSMAGIETDGKPFKADLSKVQQYKIITPTHWMYVNYDTDSLRGGGNGGTYELKGNKYIEALTENYKTDFTVKVEGDKYYQDGFILFPDGKKLVLNEVYQRVPEPANATSDIVGVWAMTAYTIARDGKKVEEKGVTELQINTPTHSMWIDKKDGKFWMGALFSYTKQGNKIIAKPIIASFPIDKKDKEDITATVKGNQMTSTVKVVKANGKTEEWNMVHQRVGKPEIAKVVSTKK